MLTTCRRLLLLSLLPVLLSCDDGSSGAPTAVTSPPSVSPTAGVASPKPTGVPSPHVDQQLAITFADGKVSGDTGRVAVRLGSRVRIVVTSDVADELHLHVYDLKRPVGPGRPAEIVFTADVPGQITVELEHARRQLVRLVIS